MTQEVTLGSPALPKEPDDITCSRCGQLLLDSNDAVCVECFDERPEPVGLPALPSDLEACRRDVALLRTAAKLPLIADRYEALITRAAGGLPALQALQKLDLGKDFAPPHVLLDNARRNLNRAKGEITNAADDRLIDAVEDVVEILAALLSSSSERPESTKT